MRPVRDGGRPFRLAPGVLTVGALFLIWVVSSWFIADHILESRARSLIRDESAALEKRADNIARNIARNLQYLHGIPLIIAKDDRVLSVLSRSEASVTRTSLLPVEEKKRLWTEDPVLKRINGYLAFTGSSLAADVLWIMDTSGDCIAASNAGSPTSFVGTNYADRHYFQMARAGKTGNQYAMGRKTNIAGLYFSAPIFLGDRVVGAAVAKIDLVALSHWVNQADAFISDKFGVVILARDSRLEMHVLPGAGLTGLSKTEQEARYKRSEFPPMRIEPWSKGHFPSVFHFSPDGTPLLLAERSLPNDDVGVHVFTPLTSFASFDASRREMFALLVLGGLALAGALAGQAVLSQMRKEAAVTMARSLSLLHATIESTADGILVIDNERHITTCNRRFAEMWNIPEEALATGKDEVLLERAVEMLKDPSQFLEKLTELYAHPEATSTDIISFKDGRLLERYTYPQRLDDRVLGRVWAFRDVSARQRAEEALRKSESEIRSLNIELEQRVADRTAELESFAYTVAHDLKTPLRGVDGFAAMLLEDEGDRLTDEGRRMLGRIRSTSQRGGRLIEDLLRLAQLTKAPLRLRPVDLSSLAALVSKRIEASQPDRNVEWVIEPGLTAQADAALLEEVLGQLLGNAWKFTSKRANARIDFGATGKADQGGKRTFFVRDNGAGFDMAHAGELFGAFHRAHTDEEFPGLGIGLAIVEKIVQRHGGTIWAEGEVGESATVYFTL